MPYLLGIDIGTSGTKTLICDEDGNGARHRDGRASASLRPSPAGRSRTREDWWEATIAWRPRPC